MSASDKSTFNGWYVVAILAAITVGVFLTGKWEMGRSAKPAESEVTPGSPDGPAEGKTEDPRAVAPAPEKTDVQRNRLEAKATKRLSDEPQVIKTDFKNRLSDKKFSKYSEQDKFAMREKGEGQLKEEALRVVRKMPNWDPAMRRGEKVRVKYTLPISFRLK